MLWFGYPTVVMKLRLLSIQTLGAAMGDITHQERALGLSLAAAVGFND